MCRGSSAQRRTAVQHSTIDTSCSPISKHSHCYSFFDESKGIQNSIDDVFHWNESDMFEKRETDPKLYKIYEAIGDFRYRDSILYPMKIINELRLIIRDYSEKPDYCFDKIKKEYIYKSTNISFGQEHIRKCNETGPIIVECLKRLIIDPDCKFWWLFEQDKDLKNKLNTPVRQKFSEILNNIINN
jgi:hypothetical protein